MLVSLNELRGYKILGQEDELGKIHDFYLDDVDWVIRYIVVNTGPWFLGKKVLMSPWALHPPKLEEEVLSTDLTQKQFEGSPDIDVHKPISRQMEESLTRHFGWPVYWEPQAPTAGVAEPTPPVWPVRTIPLRETENEKSTHLRSTQEVENYAIQAKDGDIGHVEDFIVDDETWAIRYMVIDTVNWFPGKKVLLAPEWIKWVSWTQQTVSVDMDRDRIKNAPEYDPSGPINRQYEDSLYDHYGRPKYWTMYHQLGYKDNRIPH